MLTPAEEMGLNGLNLASRVRKAFHKITEGDVVAMMKRVREESAARHLIYARDGQDDVINVMPCPITVLPHQLSYVHSVSLTILNALKRLPEFYLQDAAVREVLKIGPEEEEWIRECWSPGQADNNPVFGRLDAVVDFISPMWKDSMRFVEPNLSCVGGLHMIPTAERLVADVVFPLLQDHDSKLHLEVGPDIRELLMQEVLDHLQTIGRPARTICFAEFLSDSGTGPDEQGSLAQYYHDRYGLEVLHADPTALTRHNGEVCFNGKVIDLVYRDYEVRDLVQMRRDGIDVEPLRELFRQNRVISSIAAELDQKCCWEVLTDPALTRKYFNSDERQVFRRHILWTRYLADRKTLLPDGQTGDLLPYVRREQETLVLKPNRSFGGKGVVLGHLLSRAEWEGLIEQSLKSPERWVVQQLASIPVSEFPVLDAEGRLHVEPFYVVMGFAATQYGLAILGRSSQKQVVNVAQRGGLCVVAIGHPPAKLIGPDASP